MENIFLKKQNINKTHTSLHGVISKYGIFRPYLHIDI